MLSYLIVSQYSVYISWMIVPIIPRKIKLIFILQTIKVAQRRPTDMLV